MAKYRGIDPKLTFEGANHPINLQQFNWGERTQGALTCLYAGKVMMIFQNDDGVTFNLSYLDFEHPTKFNDIEEAKWAAADFARAVLLRMLEYVGVRKEDHTLSACLAASGH